MDTITTANLRDLAGGWSCFVFAIGLSGSFLSHRASRRLDPISKIDKQYDVIVLLPWAMLMLVFFLSFFLGASLAYSGPASLETLVHRRYDRTFAPLIALAFGNVFALDTLRFGKLRRQAFTWLCLAFFLFLDSLLVAEFLKNGRN
jgi:hypothetical protein